MPNSVNPPTESGWYVVETDGIGYQFVGTFDVLTQHFLYANTVASWTKDGFEGIDGNFTITRWSGPLDLEALLQQGGKE